MNFPLEADWRISLVIVGLNLWAFLLTVDEGSISAVSRPQRNKILVPENGVPTN